MLVINVLTVGQSQLSKGQFSITVFSGGSKGGCRMAGLLSSDLWVFIVNSLTAKFLHQQDHMSLLTMKCLKLTFLVLIPEKVKRSSFFSSVLKAGFHLNFAECVHFVSVKPF